MTTLAYIAALLLLLTAAPASGSPGSSLMDISADGVLLACSNRDSGTVTFIDLKKNQKTHEVKVGHKPEGVTFLGNSHTLAVAVYFDDKIAFVDGDKGTVTGETEVFDEPYGVAATKDGTKLYVTLTYPSQLVEIDVASKKVTRTIDAGSYLRGLALSHDNKTAFVTEYYSSRVLAIDLINGQVKDQWPAPPADNICRQIIVHPKRDKAYITHMRSAVTNPHGEGSIFPYVSVLTTSPAKDASDKRRNRLPMDSFISVRVTANPWDCDITPDGRKFFVIFSGTNDLFACDVIDDDYRELVYSGSVQLGNNPRAIRVAPNGLTFYVYNALDFEVVAYDVKSLRRIGAMSVCDNPMSEELLLGKRLFYTALQPMASRKWISCSSCHIDGETDGRTWHNPEGLRNTPALFGMAWTHPLHWSADRDETQDFEHTIRGQLMQGSGLVRGRIYKDLDQPNKGLSKELDALSAYSNSHTFFPLSPHAKKGLSDAAQRGKSLFFSKETQCATCHKGPYFTDSMPAASLSAIVRHDVGTGKDDASEKMGPAYDTPSLLGIYRTAPYLHHGKANTLEEVLTTSNKGDRHGKTSHLSKSQITDLVEFLKALPYEDPVPAAIKAGMEKVER